MKRYIVLYQTSTQLLGDPPLAHICQADSVGSAETQTSNTYPNCDVVWVSFSHDSISDSTAIEFAYDDYWNQ